MRFLSIAAFAGLIATTSVAARTSDTSDANLEARTWGCNKGQERNRWGMCVDCPEGKYSPYGTSCDTCPTGSSCGSRESSCVCQPGYYLQSYGGRTSGAACNACPSGYVSGTGASSCTKCPANTYANGSQCKPCENGYVSDAGSASCTPKCGAGYYLSNGSCKKCGPGSYSPGGAASCTTCPTGTFCNSEGASSCNNCPAGQTSGPGAKDCVPFNCPAGKYKLNGACADCPAGSYSGPNASSCSQCPANTFSTGGSSSCTSCPRGSSCLPGSSQCSSGCKAGQFSNNGKCETCPAGWYSQAGATSCSDCPDDTYSSAGASSCTKCPTGKGCGGRSTTINQCIDKCPDGQVYQNGRCSSCPAGKYSNNNQCSECPPGAVSNPGSNSCTQCPPGKIPNENGKNCGECPANTYSNGDNCTPCPAGSTSPKGSSSCGPQPSKRAVPFFTTIPSCYGPGMQLCDVPGSSGSECLNTFATLDSCGGCVAPYGDVDTTGKYTGRDCSAIPHVDTVECVNGGCEIKSCQSGYEPSGDSCVEKAAYVGKNQTAHGARAKRSLLGSRHDSF